MVAEELARIVQAELVDMRQRNVADTTARIRLENQLGELKVCSPCPVYTCIYSTCTCTSYVCACTCISVHASHNVHIYKYTLNVHTCAFLYCTYTCRKQMHVQCYNKEAQTCTLLLVIDVQYCSLSSSVCAFTVHVGSCLSYVLCF